MEGLWRQICQGIGVSDQVSLNWYNTIRERYAAGGGRSYHSIEEMLEKHKLSWLKDQNDTALFFAIIFQYTYFDPKSDSSPLNCQVFNEFAKEIQLDVSVWISFERTN